MSVDVLKLELSEDATRKSIFGQLISAIPDETERLLVGTVVGDLSIRIEQQFHNLAEVEDGIMRTIAKASAKENAKAIYRILAEAEAEVHGCSLEETHFHEVGRGMTAREILGICTAFEVIDAQKVVATAIQTGSGTVECSHGVLDIPAPATAAILKKYDIPVAAEKLDGELCTPTSAAIIAHFVSEFV